jgi:chloride channel 3/4/5
MNPFRTGQLVMFQVKYDRSWHFFEILFYLIIGAFGGLYGAFVIKWNLKMQVFRKKYLGNYPITEAVTLAMLTAIICYPNMFLRIDMTESMEILFQECENGHDYDKLCDRDQRWHMIGSLAIATIIRTLLVVISFGCKVPAGIFVPSMAVGAAFGRMVGIFVQHIHESFPNSAFFNACEPDGPCITPGTYAFLGAAAALSGIMHISISVVVIMFEITGALTYILPTMVNPTPSTPIITFTNSPPQIVVGVTKAVSERFGHGGIADRMIYLNGYPFLDNKEDHVFGVPVSKVMSASPIALPATGMQLRHLERIMTENHFQGYPIVEDTQSKILIGYIGRTELKYAVEKARKEGLSPGHAKCSFTSLAAGEAGSSGEAVGGSTSFDTIPATSSAVNIDFSRYIDPTPLSVHPRLPLETVMELFKKMGPRVILIEYRGRLTGLVTIKDCLKYQFKVEAGHAGVGNTNEEGMERAYGVLRIVGLWVEGALGKVGLGNLVGRGEVRLVSPVASGSGARRVLARGDEDGPFAVGDEDEDGDGMAGPGVELEDIGVR